MSATNSMSTLTAALTAYTSGIPETAWNFIEDADVSELRVMSFMLIGLLDAVAAEATEGLGIADRSDYWAQWLPLLGELGARLEES